MHLYIINGSPKGKGNTYKVIVKVLSELNRLDSNLTYEIEHLKTANLKLCRGCYRCLENGQDKCPLNDDQKIIEEKMKSADGIIFASPVYVTNVSWMFKNFLDRFAYICHRPMYHGKKAMVLCTTGSVASGVVNIIMKVSVETWGFQVVSKIGAIVSPGISEDAATNQWEENNIKIRKAALKFYKGLMDNRPVKATFTKLLAFRLQKKSFQFANPEKADFQYWKAKGWLDKRTDYYIDAKVNPIKKWIAYTLAEMQLKQLPKGAYYDELN